MANNKYLPKILVTLFILTFVLLSFATVNGTRAALNERAEENDFTMTLKYIGVSLEESLDGENYKEIAYKTWDGDKEEWTGSVDAKLSSEQIGDITVGASKNYRLRVAAKDRSTISEYVRVVVRKYWTKEGSDEKDYSLNKDFINVDFNTLFDSEGHGWISDPSNDSNKETKIFYYNYPIGPENNEEGFASYTSDFVKGIGLNDTVSSGDKIITIKDYYSKTEKTEGTKTYTIYNYYYDGRSFAIEVEADAVQTHNAQKAIKSAWGIDVTVDSKTHLLKLGGE